MTQDLSITIKAGTRGCRIKVKGSEGYPPKSSMSVSGDKDVCESVVANLESGAFEKLKN